MSGSGSQQSGVQNSAAIQKLLLAEKKGQEIVAEARAYRATRAKAARDEARAEINAFKAQKEKEFEAEKKRQSEEHSTESEARAKIAEEKAKIDQAVANKGEEVIQMLLTMVTTVDPKAHRNVNSTVNTAAREATQA